MKIQEIISKSIISKTGIPSADYVINPYVGCSHSCFYCYARFMKRFTDHKENWGDFIDVKINAPYLIPVLKDDKTSKYTGKRILLSSVTDPYIPLESKYKLTRQILKNLIPHQPHVTILTKSHLVLRDIDLMKQFKNIDIGFSFSTHNEYIRKRVEPCASSFKDRLKAIKAIHEEHITSYVFISPIIPFITDWKILVNKTRDYADYFMFENLNVVGNVWGSVNKWLKADFPELLQDYKDIYFEDSLFWERIEEEIITFCKTEKLDCKIYFHH